MARATSADTAERVEHLQGMILARIIPWRCSTRSAVSAEVARAMTSQPPSPIGERAVPGGSSSGLQQTAAARRATSPGIAGEWTQEHLRHSEARGRSFIRG